MKFIKSVVKATAASLAIMSPVGAYLAISMSSTPQKAIAITALLALWIAMIWPYFMQPSKKNTYFMSWETNEKTGSLIEIATSNETHSEVYQLMTKEIIMGLGNNGSNTDSSSFTVKQFYLVK